MKQIEENILYDLLIHVEWPLETDVIGGDAVSQGGSVFYRAFTHAPKNVWSLLLYSTKYLVGNGMSTDLSRIFSSGSEWQLAVGAHGAIIAVLQNNCLEIRAKKDDYASAIGKNSYLYCDPFPSWRKVCWSSECSMIAVAYSNGMVEIFNTVGASLFTIYPPRFQEGKVQLNTSESLASLFFSETRTQQMKWSSELIMIDFHGTVRGYYVSPTEGYQESHSFSFYKLYPIGISAAVNIGSLLLVCGSCSLVDDPMLKNNGMGHGLSIWRMVGEYPFYKQVPTFDEDEHVPLRESFLSRISFLKSTSSYDSVFRLCVSPLGRQVVALHASGSISLWDIPSLRKRKFWSLDNQPSYENISSSAHLSEGVSQELRSRIADVRWWSEDAIIIVRFSGAVTICSTQSLTNLLGESPEVFEGVPQVSDSFDKSFLGLEIEKKLFVSSPRKFQEFTDEETNEIVFSHQEENENLGALQRYKFVFNKVMFWITDYERFRPFNKQPKILSRTGRLLSLKSISPAELFSRKIESEEYGEALALAQRYNLDCNLVYQQQWRKNPVTLITIQDYLVKISSRSWVLQECLNRVPEDVDAARELLLYGLRGTELDTLVAVGQGKRIDEFVVSDLDVDYDCDYDINTEEAQDQAEEWAAKDLKTRRELLSQIDFNNLNEEQIEIIKARQKLLVYYDRLEDLVGGGVSVAERRYDAKFYEKFRNQSDTEAAIEFAKNCNWEGVEVMFISHYKTTWPHRLAILSCFPSTMGPYEYSSLLPECDLNGEVFDDLIGNTVCHDFPLRDEDWCEDILCRKVVGLEEDSNIDDLYEENEDLKPFRNVKITAEVVSSWYKYRAQDIERTSHFVDVALDLLKLGREKNIPDLVELHNTFDTLELLVYEVGLTNITLKELQNLDDLEKLKLLMSTTEPDTFVQNIRRWGLPFLSLIDKKELGRGIQLFKDYLVFTSTENLSFALKAVQHSQQDSPDPIIQSTEDLYEIVVNCIYSCEKDNQLPRSFAMLECLPVKKIRAEAKHLTELYERVDRLDDHLVAAELLSSYGILVSPSTLRNTETDENKIRLMLTRLARTATRKDSKLTEDNWQKLLNDMLELRQKIFKPIDPQTCFEILTESLLSSGVRKYIDFGRELLVTTSDASPIHNPYLQKIMYPVAVSLVIKAATEYFNSSESYTDSNMELARHCLNIIESENEHIQREMDLIASLELLPDIGIYKLPLQIRLCGNRLELIKEALRDNPDNHIYGSRILRLADLFRIFDKDQERRNGEIYALLAEASYQAGDLISSCSWCSQILKIRFSKGWAICSLLGRCKKVTDFSLRVRFLDFALTYATIDHLEDLLIVRNQVELSILYEKVSRKIDTVESFDSEEGFVDARSESETESEEEWSETQMDSSRPSDRLLSLPLSFTKTVLFATAATTTSLVSTVANKKLWKNATSFLRPLEGLTLTLSEGDLSASESNLSFEKQGCHAFVSALYPDCHISNLGSNYNSYAAPSISNSALDVSWHLLRIALVEETLSLGKFAQLNRNVLDEVTKGFLVEDWMSGFAFLGLNSSTRAEELLVSLPRTEISLLTSLFYHGLQIYNLLHPSDGSGIAPVFLNPPMNLIAWASNFAQHGIVPLSKEKETRFHIDKFLQTEGLIKDFLQAQTLQKLGAGIDMDRFLNDDDYKKDSVLGLAMFTEQDVFSLAVDLAKKYNVCLWQVYMTHLQFLFDSDMSCKQLENQVKQRKIMDVLIEKPSEFVSTMQKDVLFTISGTDYDRLRYLYFLILQVAGDQSTKEICSCHIESLCQLQSRAFGLDYKNILFPTSDSVELIKPFIAHSNVSELANVTKCLQKLNIKSLDSGLIYCAWTQKQFFENRPKRVTEWVKRYKDAEMLFKEMKSSDVKSLIRSLTFSGEASESIPMEARKEIIKNAFIYAENQLEQYNDEAEEKQCWANLVENLEKLKSHLELLCCQTFRDLASSNDPKLREYAKQFELSSGEEIVLQKLSHKVLQEFSPLETLRSLLAIYPDDLLAEDIFMQVFNDTLQSIKDLKENQENEELFAVLDHLLKEFSHYVEEGGELLQEDDILDELRSFSSDSEYPSAFRITVLRLAQKYMTFTQEDNRLLQSMQTGGIVNAAFNSPREKEKSSTIPPEQIETGEARMNLFDSLLKRMDTVKKAQSILELLSVWPPFESQVYANLASNPWTKVFFKIFGLYKATGVQEYLNLVHASSQIALQKQQIPDECIDVVVDNILSLGSSLHLKIATKIAISSPSLTSQNTVLDVYKSLNKISGDEYDVELLDLLIEKEFVSKIVTTCLYAPLINYLNESNDLGKREKIIQQLESSNHWMEAASLAMLGSSFPRSLKIASNAFNIFKRKT